MSEDKIERMRDVLMDTARLSTISEVQAAVYPAIATVAALSPDAAKRAVVNTVEGLVATALSLMYIERIGFLGMAKEDEEVKRKFLAPHKDIMAEFHCDHVIFDVVIKLINKHIDSLPRVERTVKVDTSTEVNVNTDVDASMTTDVRVPTNLATEDSGGDSERVDA